METMVSRKPSDVCTVSAVPTACGGTASVTSALNCAESAMTKNPHAHASEPTIQSDLPNANGIMSEQAPLRAMASMTSRSRPRASADSPPQTQPSPPTAIVPKATAETSPAAPADLAVLPCCAATLAARNNGIHVQNE